LPGLAEGSFSDAFGSSENRSQGFAIGLTHMWAPRFVGDFRLGWTRGDYFIYPPNFGIDGPAEVGLQNVPDDPSIVGGLPKIGLQGYDAIGRHTSTPQSQTPRSWNPRATFSLHEGRHALKFGYEFLRVQTRINDLAATIGAMNFSDLFTGKAVGDLLLGLPSVLALTSLAVIDQHQNMHFVFVQDDFRIAPDLTINLGVRYEYATPPMENDNRLANFDPATGTMQLAADGSVFDRARVHPDRNDWAPRIGFAYSPAEGWVVRGAYGVFYSHTVRQGREGLLGYNPPFVIDNLIFTPAFGPFAVVSNALFRLEDGYPPGLLDPAVLSPFAVRRGQDPNQRSPYVQQFNLGIQRELTPDLLLDVAYVGNKGTKLPGFRNLNTPEVIVNPDGSHAAGLRPYPTLGDVQWIENRVLSNYHALQVGLQKRFSSGLAGSASYTWGKALTEAPEHLSTAVAGPGLDTGVFSVPQNANDLDAERGPAPFDVAHRLVVSYVYELPWGRDRRWGQSWGAALDMGIRRLADIGHPCRPGWASVDSDAGRKLGPEPRRPARDPPERGRGSRAAALGADRRALVQHGCLRAVQPSASGVRQRGRRHHAWARSGDLRLLAGQERPPRRNARHPVPHGVLQRVQSSGLQPAGYPGGFEHVWPGPLGARRPGHSIRAQVVFLICPDP
jgi:hypothetical protein